MTSSSPPGDRGTPDPDLHSPRVAEVFAQLFDAHAADLRRYVCARAGEHHADDLVAEAFAVAIDRRSTYDPSRAPVRAWLFGITHTLLRAHFRSQDRAERALARVHGERAVSETAPEGLVTARVDASRRLEVIASALAELTEDERDVLLLSSWAHLEPAEIAEILSVPASTVRSRLHRTRTRLRTLLLDSENLQQASGEN